MKMRKQEKGMTLVELLAAITLLAIIFVGVFSVFPQMTSMNVQTETKLETMNLARVELNELKKPYGDQILKNDYNDFDLTGEYRNKNNPKRTIFTDTRIVGGTEYVYEVTHYEEPYLELDEEEKDKIADTPMSENIVELFLIHIQIKQNDKVISETFGFVPYSIVATDIVEVE